ncbi:hypothetical protein U8335_03900 [Roseiconus lacunae]|uniref:hypothetical protein n=1 Tax=Roseiconus lacunae TaxID=2605694 RepID=UPI0030921F6C|nr:hypothetical protein U8335_03900 [Stieleria sp. HD01]
MSDTNQNGNRIEITVAGAPDFISQQLARLRRADDVTRPTITELATEIADALLTVGSPPVAVGARLVVMDADEKDLGGRIRGAIIREVGEILSARLEGFEQ